MNQAYIYQGSHTGLCVRYSVRCKRIKIGIYSQTKGTSSTQLKHWQAKTQRVYLFGKKFKISYQKCQEAKYRNVEEKGERKSSLLPPLNLILGDLKSNSHFQKGKRHLFVFSSKIFICIFMLTYRQTDKIYTSIGKVQTVHTDQ